MSIGLVMTTTTKSTTTNESNSSRSCSTLIRSLVSSSFSLIIRRHSNSCLSEHHHHHHHPNNGGSRSHHRHYRSRCHHPFLPNWSSNLIQLYIVFILLINTVYNYNTSIDDDIISHGQGIQRTNSFSDNDSEPRNTSIRLVNVNNNNNKDKNNAPYVIEEYVCGGLDIRNSVSQFKKLENCTVIEGSLQIVLIDNGTAKDFENITFPKLREITDFFLIFRVMGLQSLSKLFPNLTVIRGRELLHNYALIIYEMLQLQDIGLRSLTNIIRGDVRIEKNPNLCYVETIDWSRITRNYMFQANMDPSACTNCNEQCPIVSARRIEGNSTMVVGDNFSRVCWSGDICQKRVCSDCDRYNRTCSESGECCPEQCIGGCIISSTNPSNQTCFACKNFIFQNRCYEKCPPNTFLYYNRRCVTKEECHNLSSNDDLVYKAFMNKCESFCPVGYIENVNDKHLCDHCGGDCPKVCQSSVVSNIQTAQSLKGCTKINGSLEIYVSSGGAEIVKELEENLKYLTEISGYLKIARSFPLITLNFLRNLKVIHGNKLERQAYSLLILDNPNLQDLWTFEHDTIDNKTKRIQIKNGRIFLHINPKLCYNRIKKLVDYVEFGNWSVTWDEGDVSSATNGDKVPCEVDPLHVKLWGVHSFFVVIIFENFKKKMEDPRLLLGYLIYYRETEHQNVSIFDGRDACSTNDWSVIEFDDTTDANSTNEHTHIIPELKPFTQYALYIKTYTIASASRGAQSAILYFKTQPAMPTQPRSLFAKATKHNEIKIKWDSPSKPNGDITHYIVTASKDELVPVNRDFCSDSIIKRENRIPTTPVPLEPIVNVWTNGSRQDSDSSKKTAQQETDKQCCSCKNERIRPSNVEQNIDFEDHILNTVYIKRKHFQPQEISRRKRVVSNETINEANSFKIFNETLSTDSSFASILMNEANVNIVSNVNEDNNITTSMSTELSNNKKWEFRREVFQREILIDQLTHYTEYTITVQACQDESVENRGNSSPCSLTAITSVRTLPLAAADDIDERTISYTFGNSTHDSKYKLINIKWDEPINPNGFIISYQIEHRRITTEPLKQVVSPICVSREVYATNNYGYNLELPSGNYTVRIRAHSLASYGNWTEPFYIFIEEPRTGSYLYAIIIGCLIFMILAISILSYKLKQGRSKLNYISVNPDYMGMGITYEPDPAWEVPREKITLIKERGKGSFGMVYEGELIRDKEVIKCAVKTLNDGTTQRQRVDFLKEADVMKSFTDCHHVVKLLGIVSTPPAYVLMEIMSRGDLREFLRDNRPESEKNLSGQPPSLTILYKMAIEIADGMAYLASKKFVHRDLAARNCMVAEDLTVKIGDFGMTRDVYETDYYRKGGKGLLPVRWMSPESLKDGLFTTYSDVWSYGIVLWEMATLASQPYQGLSNEEVLKFVVEGGTMNQPEDCPPVLWELMVLAWERKPKSRPHFLKIIEILLEHIDKKSFLQVSYYNQWKNDRSNFNEPYSDDKKNDDPSTPLNESDDSDSHSNGDQLDDEDINVKYFPSCIVPNENNIYSQDIVGGDMNKNQTLDSNKSNSSSCMMQLQKITDSQNHNLEGSSILNNNLSASLANSESLSSSTSNFNLDTNTNHDTMLNFTDYDAKVGTNQSNESKMKVQANRNLINGHLINTSMV